MNATAFIQSPENSTIQLYYPGEPENCMSTVQLSHLSHMLASSLNNIQL